MSSTADGAGKFVLRWNGSRISLRDSGMTDLWGFGSIFCTLRERFHGHPHPAIISAKERSDASRDPCRNAGGWQRVRTHALCRSGSRISLRDSGMTALGEMRGAGGGGAGVFVGGVKEKFGYCHGFSQNSRRRPWRTRRPRRATTRSLRNTRSLTRCSTRGARQK
jgi:hypothetical protein